VPRTDARLEDHAMAVKPIPEGYHTVNSYFIVDDAAKAIEFYKRAFGAEEVSRLPMGDKIGHAEIRIGDTHLMLSDEWPDMGSLGPKARGGATSSFVIYVPDADAAFQRAVDAGATVERPVTDQFWGDRMGTVVDPFGHRWSLGTHVEDVAPEEMGRRMAAWSKEQTKGQSAQI
jgi:PhnB protein